MISVGVGNEYLSEVIASYKLYDLLHTSGIQFVKDVIEQE
jgi:hypothetical protein